MQHIGGVRTALFNYFFARSRGGRFVLRVEDTDQTRFHPDALQDIYDTFEWLGIRADESPREGGEFGPYVQSERTELYRRYTEQLLEAGRAYYDYTSVPRDEEAGTGSISGNDENVAEGRKRDKGIAHETAANQRGTYNFEGRDLTPNQIEERKAAGVVPVVRLLIPQEDKTEFEDLVLGTIKRKNKDLPADPILLKSDGFPTYHLANVVDDHLMEISHVLRAQEWVPSTPLHLLLYDAFGWEPPRFAHLPMVMGKDGSKLSKRHGSTSVIEFRRQGYLPEALINYVTMLGWSYDDSREFFSRRDLEELFRIEKINKAPAVFDYRKLDWFNGQYLRELPEDRLVEELIPYLEAEGWTSVPNDATDRSRIASLLPLIRERLKVLADVVPLVRFLYEDVTEWSAEDLIPKKATAREAAQWLARAWQVIEENGTDDQDRVDQGLHAAAEELAVKVGNLMMPLRVAITGSTVSPPLVGSIQELGMDTARERVAGARAVLENAAATE